MSNRICGRCRSTKVVIHGSYGGTTYYYCENCQDLGDKDRFPEMTIFHKLTASPEVLAPEFIFKQWHAFDGKWEWFSLLLMDGDELNSPWFKSYEEAIAAMVARLKVVEK